MGRNVVLVCLDSVRKDVFDDLPEYRTIGVSSNVYAGPVHDFDRYFDEFFPLGRGIRFPEALDPYSFDGSLDEFFANVSSCFQSGKPVRSLCNGALELLDSVSDRLGWLFDEGARPGLKVVRRALTGADEPTFAFVNLMEAHILTGPHDIWTEGSTTVRVAGRRPRKTSGNCSRKSTTSVTGTGETDSTGRLSITSTAVSRRFWGNLTRRRQSS